MTETITQYASIRPSPRRNASMMFPFLLCDRSAVDRVSACGFDPVGFV